MRTSALCRLLCLSSLALIFLVGPAAISEAFPAPMASPAPIAMGKSADVVVYGGTSAGVTAAVQVARMGHSVILIEPTKHIGGLTSGGLGFTDSGDKRVIGGLSREFYQRVRKHYDNESAWTQEKSSEYARYRANEDALWTFEPKVAEAILRQMLAEANVTLIEGERLNRESGVKLDGKKVVSIRTESGTEYTGRQFIDATYEGDLMAAAGVRFTVGREANSVYGETLNGNQVKANIHNHRFVKNVDPWKIPGDKSSGLLPGIETTGAGVDGTGDHRVQAYCFRMCMSNSPKNRRPFPKPEGYNEADYELLLRNFEAGDLRFPMKPDMMPNRKTDTNNNCAVSTDYLGANYDYPNASYEQRAAIIREHARYQKGLMWTLANHPRVPQKIRDEMAEWGLPLDEFTDNDNWPHQLYIREARRMVSDYVVTELDCRRERIVPDSVGLGSYNMDSHNVRRFVTEEGYVQNEGDVQVSPGGAYLISYRSIIPARGQASNLAVPVCLSSSHIAYGSIRMEPVFMILGQSAATACVLAMKGNVDLQDVSYAELREQMLKDKQVLDLPPQASVKPLIAKEKLPGIVLDNSDAKLTGVWSHSSSTGKYVGIDYLHDGDAEKGTRQALFSASVKEAGIYSIRMSYSANPNRASNVMVRAKSSGADISKEVNQQKTPPIDGLFVEIGSMTLKAMDKVEVSIDTAGTNGHVIIDAIQLLPAP
ncbi:MAG: FAD-dependent oxidoreductase [Planctomycetaceae bacterium]